MTPSKIICTRTGLIVSATARDFPCLADLAPFLELRPIGLAADAVAAISSVRTVGRAPC